MPETVLSMLCARWAWNPDKSLIVEFKNDGTGELYFHVEFCLFMANIFEWKALSNLDVEPSYPCSVDIEMTLTERIMDHPNKRGPGGLGPDDAAFRPKTYRLQLDKGSFHVRDRTTYGVHPTYQYCLLWDPSPLPPFEEWKDKDAVKGSKFWERKDFYRERICDAEPKAPEPAGP